MSAIPTHCLMTCNWDGTYIVNLTSSPHMHTHGTGMCELATGIQVWENDTQYIFFEKFLWLDDTIGNSTIFSHPQNVIFLFPWKFLAAYCIHLSRHKLTNNLKHAGIFVKVIYRYGLQWRSGYGFMWNSSYCSSNFNYKFAINSSTCKQI